MQIPASPFSRVLALLGLLLVAITMVCSGMSLEAGVWQKALPITILVSGGVLVVQFVSLLASGSSGIPANIVWRFAGAFGLFAGTFSLLGVIFPDTMWEVTKGTATLPPGIAAGGEVAEWSIAAVLKTAGPQGPGGSNPSLSASTDALRNDPSTGDRESNFPSHEIVDALAVAQSRGVRGGCVYDYMHLLAAKKATPR
jgi:hypothetical protein